MKTDTIKATLTRKIGPVSLWVWLLGAVAAVIFFRRSKSTTAGGDTSGTGAAGTTTADTLGNGRAAALGGSGGDLGQPLQPTDQGIVDTSISRGGTGTPVVYDPFYDPYPPAPGEPVIPGVGPAAPPNDGRISPSGWSKIPGGPTDSSAPIERPTSSIGTKKKQSAAPPAYRGGVSVVHPNAKTTITTLANGGRVEQVLGHTPYAIAPVRSSGSETPNNVRSVAPASPTPPAPPRQMPPPPHVAPTPPPAPPVTTSRTRMIAQ